MMDESSTTKSGSLYQHQMAEHTPKNINLVQQAELGAARFDKKIAIALTQAFQSMPTFWLVTGCIVIWILINVTIFAFDPPPFSLLLTLMNIPQLPMMIVIMVGQGLLGHKAELQSDEQFATTEAIYHDFGELLHHLDAQDGELVRQSNILIEQSAEMARQTALLLDIATRYSHKEKGQDSSHG